MEDKENERSEEEMGMVQKHYLEQLSTLPVEVKTRSREWRKFFPHLPGIALSRLLKESYVACPAVMVKDVIHVLSVSRVDKQTVKIGYDWAKHVRCDNSDIDDYAYAAVALEYANINWRTGRVDSSGWQEVHRIFLQDPYDLRVSDFNIWIAMKWPFGVMEDNEYSPFYEQYDRSTVHITDSWVLAEELSCGKRHNHYSRCARCGWGLCSFPCQGCETNFKYPRVHHANIGDCCLKGAMPEKTEAKFVEMGHLFTADAQAMRKKEKRDRQECVERQKNKGEESY
jgi:hypothetical protein